MTAEHRQAAPHPPAAPHHLAAQYSLAAPSCTPIGSVDVAFTIADRTASIASGLDALARWQAGPAGRWEGAAAQAFLRAIAVFPREFATAAEACRSVSAALSRHAETLADAGRLLRQAAAAEATDPAGARLTAERAAALARESARRAAAAVDAAADAAPAAPGRATRLIRAADEARAELALGTAEATQALVSLAARLQPSRAATDPAGTAADMGALARTAGDAVRDPLGTLAALIEWDTWRTNPARAAGRLVPDAAAALATGGAAAVARSGQVGARTAEAAQKAAARDAVRRSTAEVAATTARLRLIEEAQRLSRAVPPRPRIPATGLPPEKAAVADTFLSLTVRHEPALTRSVEDAARNAGGDLAGLQHRVKSTDSYHRKLALKDDGGSFGLTLDRVEDTLRYTVRLEYQRYVPGVRAVAAELEQQGFHAKDVKNFWVEGDRYRGINTVWQDPRSGATFELQFHTPDSYRITVETHPMYEEMREAGTPATRKEELRRLIATEYSGAGVPDDVHTITTSTFPPPSPPDPVHVPHYPVPAGAAAGTTSATLGEVGGESCAGTG